MIFFFSSIFIPTPFLKLFCFVFFFWVGGDRFRVLNLSCNPPHPLLFGDLSFLFRGFGLKRIGIERLSPASSSSSPRGPRIETSHPHPHPHPHPMARAVIFISLLFFPFFFRIFRREKNTGKFIIIGPRRHGRRVIAHFGRTQNLNVGFRISIFQPTRFETDICHVVCGDDDVKKEIEGNNVSNWVYISICRNRFFKEFESLDQKKKRI